MRYKNIWMEKTSQKLKALRILTAEFVILVLIIVMGLIAVAFAFIFVIIPSWIWCKITRGSCK